MVLSLRKLSEVLLSVLPLMSNAQTCQTENIPATTPDSQLIDHGNGTVTDSKTGLMWKQCSEGLSGTGCVIGTVQGFTWQAALQQAQTINTTGGFAGFTDWRLPNIKELRSLAEKQCISPAINLTRFPNTPSTLFWSSSHLYFSPMREWYTNFDDGSSFWIIGYWPVSATQGLPDRIVSGHIVQFPVRLVRNVQ